MKVMYVSLWAGPSLSLHLAKPVTHLLKTSRNHVSFWKHGLCNSERIKQEHIPMDICQSGKCHDWQTAYPWWLDQTHLLIKDAHLKWINFLSFSKLKPKVFQVETGYAATAVVH